MAANLPPPVGAQRNVVYLRSAGHVVVLGTAGSGKTTMAVLRAMWLADHAPQITGRTLLVTFNRALVTYIRKHMKAEGTNLVVENYHAFARGYLASQGLMGSRDIANRAPLVMEAIENVRRHFPDRQVLSRALGFFEDELHWMAGHGVSSEKGYIEAERIGRGRPLSPSDRQVVYAVQQEYLRLRQAAGKRYDWDDMALATRVALAADSSPRFYRHVVVDEGQDFSPEMIRSLAAAVGDEGSLTFFGDYAQQMYGSRLSWRSLGLNVRQGIVRFEQNYRNSPQIARLAVALSNMPFFRDEVDLVEPKGAAADGPLPIMIEVTDRRRQLEEAVRLSEQLGKSMTVAILSRRRNHDAFFRRRLPAATRLRKDLTTWPAGPGVFFGTYYSAKGLEFDAVVLPFCDDDQLPDPDEAAAHGQAEAAARESRLLYVAITRARTRLYLLYSDRPTSLLPSEPSLLDRTTL